ncbi:transporter [Ideonella azotifigens]|uniref:Transporter n=2 Tax=Ideonella azotifigens TaxID=513160 RepID=A0ABP3VMN0_9BURK
MTMRLHSPLSPLAAAAALALAIGLPLASGLACAQSQSPAPPGTEAGKPAPVPPPAVPDADAARDALKAREGDINQATLLKETLSAADKQYSLLKAGQVSATYDLNYSYIGTETINAKFTDSTLTLFEIQNTRAHTITNTGSVDYGLLDNLTGSFTLPLVSRYSQSTDFGGISHGLGDISLGLRWQPFALHRDGPTYTGSASLRLPTGRSPYTTIVGQNVATGSGNTAITLGGNVSQVLDPVALFGSLNFTFNLPARNLSQERDGLILTEVRPGTSVGFGFGFAYALSYKVSTTMSLQETISARSKLKFVTDDEARTTSSSLTATQTSGMLNFGLGLRVSPKTTVNVTVGVGLSTDSPDFTLGLNMPLSF